MEDTARTTNNRTGWVPACYDVGHGGTADEKPKNRLTTRILSRSLFRVNRYFAEHLPAPRSRLQV
jgi:hypothetical protein